MNKSDKIYDISGVKVISKEEATPPAGKNAGKKYWRLIITCETHPEIKKINVFDNKVGTAGEISSEEIMNDVKNSNYADQRYLFWVYRRVSKWGGNKWDLAGWKKLKNK